MRSSNCGTSTSVGFRMLASEGLPSFCTGCRGHVPECLLVPKHRFVKFVTSKRQDEKWIVGEFNCSCVGISKCLPAYCPLVDNVPGLLAGCVGSPCRELSGVAPRLRELEVKLGKCHN